MPIQDCLRAAEQGDHDAQYRLGIMLADGDGVPRDGEESAKWLRQAAVWSHGQTRLTFTSGCAEYRDGKVFPLNCGEAAQVFRQVAALGGVDARFKLGWMAAFGVGVPQDIDEARTLFRKAAAQGHGPSQFSLGVLCIVGQEVPDYTEAVRWFRMTVAQGHDVSRSKGSVLEDLLVTESERDFTEDIRKASATGDSESQYKVGRWYFGPFNAPQCGAEAVRWFRLAADQGHADARCALGYSYRAGAGVPQDWVEAARWYRLSAEQGHHGAQYNLGKLYRSGQGVPHSPEEATRWYRLAAEQGHHMAMIQLGEMYRTGEGVAKDDAEAARLLRQAAEENPDMDSFKGYGACWNASQRKQAMAWFSTLADRGERWAAAVLKVVATGATEPIDELLLELDDSAS